MLWSDVNTLKWHMLRCVSTWHVYHTETGPWPWQRCGETQKPPVPLVAMDSWLNQPSQPSHWKLKKKTTPWIVAISIWGDIYQNIMPHLLEHLSTKKKLSLNYGKNQRKPSGSIWDFAILPLRVIWRFAHRRVITSRGDLPLPGFAWLFPKYFWQHLSSASTGLILTPRPLQRNCWGCRSMYKLVLWCSMYQ